MRRRAGVTGAVGVVAMAAAASVAWACTAISAVYSINPAAAPAGTEVVVTGRDFWPRAVEIRWNSVDGPVIGTAHGPDFDSPAVIPGDAAPGHYRVFAIQEGSRNPHISFRVIAPAAPEPDPGHQAPAPTLSEGPGPADAETPWLHDAGADSPAPATSASSPPAAGSGSSPSGRAGPGGGASGPPSPPRPGPGGPSANSPNDSPAPPAASAAPAAVAQPSVARRSASGEVSFASPWKNTATARGASLARPHHAGGPAAGLGAVLLVLGLVGLAGVTTVAGARRRAGASMPSPAQDSL